MQTAFSRIRLLLVYLLLLTPFILSGASRALNASNNSPIDWVSSRFAARKTYDEFVEVFGPGDALIVSWPGCFVDQPRLDRLAQAWREAEVFRGEDGEPCFFRVISGRETLRQLTTGNSAVADIGDSAPSDLPESADSPAPPGGGLPSGLSIAEAVKRLRGTLIGSDGRTTCVVLMFSRKALKRRADLVRLVRRSISISFNIEDSEIRMAGPVVDGLTVDEASQRSLAMFAAPSALVIFAICWWSLRSLRAAVLVFLNAAFCQASVLAIIDYSGESLSALLIILPPLIQVLAVAGGIHLTNYYFDAPESFSSGQAAVHAFQQGWQPCTLSAATTVMGTASLMLSQLTPIRLFGAYATVGVILTAAAVLTLIPAGLLLVPISRNRKGFFDKQPSPTNEDPSFRNGFHAEQTPGDEPVAGEWAFGTGDESEPGSESGSEPVSAAGSAPGSDDESGFGGWWNVHHFLEQFHPLVLLGGVTAMLFGAVGLPDVRTSVRIETLFAKNSRIIQDYQWLEQNVGLLVPIEVLIRFESFSEQSAAERLRLLALVEQRVSKLPSIQATTSVLTFLPSIPGLKQATGEKRDLLLSQVIGQGRASFEKLGVLASTRKYDVWRLTAHCSAIAPLDYGELLREIDSIAAAALRSEAVRSGDAERFRAECSVLTTGIMPLVHEIQRQLLDDLFASLLSALLVISITMTLLEGGVLSGLLAMISNVFPIVVLFGAMGWLRISMDIGSVMTASVALGIAVDDTLHFLIFFRRAMDDGKNRSAAVLHACQHCGAAMIQTSISCGLGLLVFAFSDFVPTARFAVMMTILLLLALAGDLLVLPALLLSPFGRVFEKSGE